MTLKSISGVHIVTENGMRIFFGTLKDAIDYIGGVKR